MKKKEGVGGGVMRRGTVDPNLMNHKIINPLHDLYAHCSF